MFRLRKFPKPKREIVFVLAAGGNLGATQAGQLIALAEVGIVPDRIIGCSVGAINGAYFAVDPTLERAQALAALWTSGRVKEVFESGKVSVAMKIATRANHIIDADNLRRLIRDELGVERIEETLIPLEVLATGLKSGTETWFTYGLAEDVLCASAAIPGVFPPVPIGDEIYVDGGVISPCPIDRAFAPQPRDIWVLDNPRRPWTPGEHMNAMEVLLRSFSIACHETGRTPLIPPGTRLTILEAELVLDMQQEPHKFSSFEHSEALIAAGRQSVQAKLTT